MRAKENPALGQGEEFQEGRFDPTPEQSHLKPTNASEKLLQDQQNESREGTQLEEVSR